MASRAFYFRYSPTAPPAAAAVLAAMLAGALMGQGLAVGLGLLVAVCYVPLVLLSLPFGLALWIALVFVEHLPAVSVGPNAAAILIAVAWLGALRTQREALTAILRRHRRLIVALALLLSWLTVSMAWAGKPAAAAADVWQWYVAACVLAVVATTITTPKRLRLVAGAFVVGAVVSVGVGVVEQSLNSSGSALESATHTEGRLQGGGGDPNYLAAGLVPAIALAGGLVAGTKRPMARLVLLAAIGFLVIGLVETESRGGLLAALATAAAALVTYRGRRTHALLACAIPVSIAAAAFAASPPAWERVSSLNGGGNGRAELWQVAWRVTGDHPLAGVGLNNFRSESDAYVRRPGALEFVDLISERPHVVHNVYLQLLAEAGIVGLGLFLALASGCLGAAWRAACRFEAAGRHDLSALARGVMLAIGGALAASFFISNATDKRLWVLLGLGPALLAACERPTARRGGPG